MSDMLRIQHEAKDRGFDSAEFFISAPRGVFKAKWHDAYFGFFSLPDVSDGIVTQRSLPPGCEGFWSETEAQEHFDNHFRKMAELAAALESAGVLHNQEPPR
jgi:hypothetical protein